MYATLQQEA